MAFEAHQQENKQVALGIISLQLPYIWSCLNRKSKHIHFAKSYWIIDNSSIVFIFFFVKTEKGGIRGEGVGESKIIARSILQHCARFKKKYDQYIWNVWNGRRGRRKGSIKYGGVRQSNGDLTLTHKILQNKNTTRMFIIITSWLNSVTFESKGYNNYGMDSNRISFEFERIYFQPTSRDRVMHWHGRDRYELCSNH